MDSLKNIRTRSSKYIGMNFSFIRRRFLKIIGAMAVAPLWAMACDRPAEEGRQGETQMQIYNNQTAAGTAASSRSIPVIDTHLPDIIHTATFAMG